MANKRSARAKATWRSWCNSPSRCPRSKRRKWRASSATTAPDLAADVRQHLRQRTAAESHGWSSACSTSSGCSTSWPQRRISQGKMVSIDPTLLAKIVVIQGRYRDLYRDLLEYPNLIQELDLRARGMTPETEGLAIPGLEDLSALVETLHRRPPVDAHPAHRQRRSPTSRRWKSAGICTSPRPPDATRRSRSNPTSACGTTCSAAICPASSPPSSRAPAEPQRSSTSTALAKLLHRDRVTPIEQRLSAAWAMGYLDDPRDFNAVVMIPAGEFPFGEGEPSILPDGLPHQQISRHQRAIRPIPGGASRDSRHPTLTRTGRASTTGTPSGAPIPTGKGNYPVVLVTWDDALLTANGSTDGCPRRRNGNAPRAASNGELSVGQRLRHHACQHPRKRHRCATTPVGVFVDGESPMACSIWPATSGSGHPATTTCRPKSFAAVRGTSRRSRQKSLCRNAAAPTTAPTPSASASSSPCTENPLDARRLRSYNCF